MDLPWRLERGFLVALPGNLCRAVRAGRGIRLLGGHQGSLAPDHLRVFRAVAVLAAHPWVYPDPRLAGTDPLPEAAEELFLVSFASLFIYPWLIWGGSIWGPMGTALGAILGIVVYRFTTDRFGSLIGIIAGCVAALVWWFLFSETFASTLQSAIPATIEEVTSLNLAGFVLSITIGIVAIVASLPIAIILALGRQSDMWIVNKLCTGFIEVIRGVPLITLLFVATILLNYFLPRGVEFDVILRVNILVTLFTAAYIAEVIRGGLAALPKGQYEAADALGLNYWQAQRLIILPQALKISIPSKSKRRSKKEY